MYVYIYIIIFYIYDSIYFSTMRFENSVTDSRAPHFARIYWCSDTTAPGTGLQQTTGTPSVFDPVASTADSKDFWEPRSFTVRMAKTSPRSVGFQIRVLDQLLGWKPQLLRIFVRIWLTSQSIPVLKHFITMADPTPNSSTRLSRLVTVRQMFTSAFRMFLPP